MGDGGRGGGGLLGINRAWLDKRLSRKLSFFAMSLNVQRNILRKK